MDVSVWMKSERGKKEMFQDYFKMYLFLFFLIKNIENMKGCLTLQDSADKNRVQVRVSPAGVLESKVFMTRIVCPKY